MKQPKKATARTTTIRIEPPSEFTRLEEQYQLVRYVLPEPLLYSKDSYKFARLHNLLKNKSTRPTARLPMIIWMVLALGSLCSLSSTEGSDRGVASYSI